ncbi:hypothetical protein [Sphingosinicella terrae]|jgi:hypothetical protein|uniref:hypothetical protein n=1 Tax=Sphingosinicella terrae TaxID=2172047 RepID=UPI000E0DCD7E|nr:hypothetical protein [Sphingosinicella terrae]
MKLALATLLAVGMVGCTAENELGSAAAPPSQALTAELSGRTAGQPLPCVSQRDLRGNRSVGNEAILFEGPGDVVYVNRPPGGCATLNSGRTLVTRTTSGRLCRGDIVTIVDPVSGVDFGSCGLGDFVPYRRAG